MNINLRLAELRKAHRLTQQELGDILSVSYQTISKWETGISLPDITILPTMSSFFNVSVDELLGLVPLPNEYYPVKSDKPEYWKNRVDYIKRTRKSFWNLDYLKFLVDNVWHIDKPVHVLDCGCGYGFLGLVLLPLLPPGSTYTGIDFTSEMLEEGKKLFALEGLDAEFILGDIFDTKAKKLYDVVISQAVLRHANNGDMLLKKMTEFLKEDGLMVTLECNREFEEDGLYIEGLEYSCLCEHEGMKKVWKTEYTMQHRDYSIAMKIPHLMKTFGLKHVDVRMSDRVTYLTPEKPGYQQLLQDIIKANHWEHEKSLAETEELIGQFMNRGMNRKDAEDYFRKENYIIRHLNEHSEDITLIRFTGIMIAYGWK